MEESFLLQPIAHMHSDFSTKFGIPRQSGLVPGLCSTIVFTPEYRIAEAVRGLEGYSHIWLIWQFSQAVRQDWSPTVRPPRLGGNTRMGVFATRSPFRPNHLGLSVVELQRVELTAQGPVLHVLGADLLDGTPIFDIKPYVAYADARPEAVGGFTDQVAWQPLEVVIPPELLELVPPEKREALLGVLAQDPRPSYQRTASRSYGFSFAGLEIRFSVEGSCLQVLQIQGVSL